MIDNISWKSFTANLGKNGTTLANLKFCHFPRFFFILSLQSEVLQLLWNIWIRIWTSYRNKGRSRTQIRCRTQATWLIQWRVTAEHCSSRWWSILSMTEDIKLAQEFHTVEIWDVCERKFLGKIVWNIILQKSPIIMNLTWRV